MRWSLVLSAFIAVQSAISFVCVALPISTQLDELERRAPAGGLKLSSKNYRANARDHPLAYDVTGLGTKGKLTDGAKVTQKKLTKAERHDHADKMLATKGQPIHADHVFEVQMLQHHFKEHKIDFNKMTPGLQNKVKGILNGRGNMALIPGSINQSKGQLVKQGMQGKKIKPQKARNQYAKLSYGTAHKTAGRLDEALKAHPGYSAAVKGHSLQQKLHDTYANAGVHPPTPPSSRSSSPSHGSSSGSHTSSQSSSRKSSPKPSTPPPTHSHAGPSGSGSSPQSLSPNRPRRGQKRQVSPGNSPPKAQQKRGGRKK